MLVSSKLRGLNTLSVDKYSIYNDIDYNSVEESATHERKKSKNFLNYRLGKDYKVMER